jgi:hypothetical protein
MCFWMQLHRDNGRACADENKRVGLISNSAAAICAMLRVTLAKMKVLKCRTPQKFSVTAPVDCSKAGTGALISF